MTCVVGLVDRGAVYIGADSAVTTESGFSEHRVDPKIFRSRDLLIGTSGSVRMAQLIRFELKPPTHKKCDTDHVYIVRHVIKALRKCLTDGGFEEGCGGTLLIGYRGCLYEVQCDFNVSRPSAPYAAVGSGRTTALGAMYATAELGWSPEARITTALEAAEHYTSNVAAPFTIEVLS